MAGGKRDGGCRGGGTPRGAYRPHNRRASLLYRCVIRHAGERRSTGRLHRPVEDEVIDRFLERADPTTALYEADPLEWPVMAQSV